MKHKIKTLLLGTGMFLLLTSCDKKTENAVKGSSSPTPHAAQRSIADVVVPADANDEMLRIYEDIQNPDYEVAIIDNPNFGLFSSSPGYDIILSGRTIPDDNIEIQLEDQILKPGGNGQWFLQSESLKSFIGKNVTVKISSRGSLLKEATVYVPKAHLASKLGEPNSLNIQRTGNTITWTPDPDNVSGKIILFYHLYSDEHTEFDTNAEMLDDNGSFNMDELLSNTDIKKIQFSLISGNTVSTLLPNGKKLLFYINTRDHHEYYID